MRSRSYKIVEKCCATCFYSKDFRSWMACLLYGDTTYVERHGVCDEWVKEK